MKEKLEKVKASLKDVIKETYLCAESVEMAGAADRARETITLLDSLIAELDSDISDNQLEAAGKAEYEYQRDAAGLKTLHALDWDKLTDGCRARQKSRLKVAIQAAIKAIKEGS